MKKGTPIQTDEKCSYGCGNKAQFLFCNKKICCREFSRQCSALQEKYVLGIKRAAIESKTVDPKTGISKAKQRYNKATNTKKKKIESNGKSVWENTSLKTKNTRSKRGEDGLNSYERGGLSSANTRKEKGTDIIGKEKMIRTKTEILDDGKSRAYHVAMKAQQTKKNMIIEDCSMAVHAAKKAANTRKNTIIDGETIEEKAIRKFKNTIKELLPTGETKAIARSKKSMETRLREGKFNGGLVKRKHPLLKIDYQGTYEKHYLDDLIACNGPEWTNVNVRRGNPIRYYDFYRGSHHWYLPDFEVLGTIVEIKSSSYWDRKNDISWLAMGFCKLEAAYRKAPVVLVLDKQEFDWCSIRENIRDRLLLTFPNEEFLVRDFYQ